MLLIIHFYCIPRIDLKTFYDKNIGTPFSIDENDSKN